MYRITKKISFCYGHRLLNYEGKCKNLHGHNAVAEIDIASYELDDCGFVMDFSDVNRIVKQWIDNELDHKMLLNSNDPIVQVLEKLGEEIYLMDKNPTAENIAELIYNYIKSCEIPVVEVRLWETPTSYASYAEKS
jgi:6-pyruvoyltetrahydropterin/6-carboxytetrahydropterin synthase